MEQSLTTNTIWLLFCTALVFLMQAGKKSMTATVWVTGFVCVGYVLGFLLPTSYFELRRFEQSGRVYRRAGVRAIRFVGSNGQGLQRLLQRIYPPWRNPHSDMSPEQWIGRTMFAERIHWSLLLCSLPAAAWAIYLGDSVFGYVLLIANVPYNLYPIMLQRYTRAQLLRIKERHGKRLE